MDLLSKPRPFLLGRDCQPEIRFVACSGGRHFQAHMLFSNTIRAVELAVPAIATPSKVAMQVSKKGKTRTGESCSVGYIRASLLAVRTGGTVEVRLLPSKMAAATA